LTYGFANSAAKTWHGEWVVFVAIGFGQRNSGTLGLIFGLHLTMNRHFFVKFRSPEKNKRVKSVYSLLALI
jgi:hypothetical protein